MFSLRLATKLTKIAPKVSLSALRFNATKAYVGGVSFDTSEETLSSAFAPHGSVVEALILKDRETGRSRGFGFVTMETEEQLQKAVEALDGSELDGRTLTFFWG